jgi:hypothetical protein
MPGLVPGIHVFLAGRKHVFLPGRKKTWMAGTSPAMTKPVFRIVVYQQARSTLGPSPTISGCHASDTAGDIRITSACAAKIAAAR